MVDAFLATGNIHLDTALMYCGGNTEKIIGRMKLGSKVITIYCYDFIIIV